MAAPDVAHPTQSPSETKIRAAACSTATRAVRVRYLVDVLLKKAMLQRNVAGKKHDFVVVLQATPHSTLEFCTAQGPGHMDERSPVLTSWLLTSYTSCIRSMQFVRTYVAAHTFIFPNFREAHKVRKVILRSTLSFQSYQLTGPVMCADFWRRECCSTTSSREPLRGADRKPR